MRKKFVRNIDILILALFVTQYMGSFSNITGAIPQILISSIYLVYNVAIVFFIIRFFFGIIKESKIIINKLYLYYWTFFIYIVISGMLVTNTYSVFFVQSIKLILTAFVAYYIVKNFSEKEIVTIIAIAQTLILFIIMYLSITNPLAITIADGDYSDNMIGLYTTKNSCAYQFAFGILIYVYMIIKSKNKLSKFLFTVLTIIQLKYLIQCHTLGALLTVSVSVVLGMFFYLQKGKFSYTKWYLSINIGFIFIVTVLLPSMSGLLSKLGKSVTLTGRTHIWNSIISFIFQRDTWLGNGYGTFWSNSTVTYKLYESYRMFGLKEEYVGAHNLFLELTLNIGMLGTLLFIILVLGVFINYDRVEKKNNLLFIIYFFFYSIRSLVERTFQPVNFDTFFFLILLCSLILKITNRKKYNLSRGNYERKEKI